jgi:hypothetical protein
MDYVQIAVTVGTGWISAVVGWYLLRNRLFGLITQFANDFIASLIKDAVEHPEKLQPLVDSIASLGMKSLGVTKEQGLPSMKIGGLKIPGYVIQALMPMLEGAIKKGVTKTAEEALKSPFS